jgi:hypothetical protein
LLSYLHETCKSCLIEERDFSNNVGQLKQKFNILTVRPETGAKFSYDDVLFHDESSVLFSVYTNLLNIKAGVFFAIMNGDGKIENHFTSVKDLMSYVNTSQ